MKAHISATNTAITQILNIFIVIISLIVLNKRINFYSFYKGRSCPSVFFHRAWQAMFPLWCDQYRCLACMKIFFHTYHIQRTPVEIAWRLKVSSPYHSLELWWYWIFRCSWKLCSLSSHRKHSIHLQNLGHYEWWWCLGCLLSWSFHLHNQEMLLLFKGIILTKRRRGRCIPLK